MQTPTTAAELEWALSEPTDQVLGCLQRLPGDVLILGAGGKMGPTLALMARRAVDVTGSARRVIAVSRFADGDTADKLASAGIDIVRADLRAADVWPRLPDAPLIVYMAGQKFGTRDAPEQTWQMNVAVPAFAAARFAESRFAVFSTGNVYPLSRADGPGSREDDAPAPVGEYAMSCLGRERVFQYAATAQGTRSCLLRLNYAVDLRYGVLVDIAQRVLAGRPVDVTMGSVNCIWQRDANAIALASLELATAPSTVLNVTGPERLQVRAVAERMASLVGVPVTFTGIEAPDALLSDTTKMQSIFGPLHVTADELVAHVVTWLQAGGAVSGKPTHFEQRGGTF